MIRFSSDYHLGVNRVAHTTPPSRTMLRQAIHQQAISVLEGENVTNINLGDLFDKFSNNEDVIRQGAEVARKCAFVMSGNHDMSNRETAKGSFELLHSLGGFNTVTETLVVHTTHNTTLVFEPHCLTQEEFAGKLSKWLEGGENKTEDYPGMTKFLLLHCNYDSKFPQKDSTLVLERDMAKKLLEVFHYILIGHEHNSRTDFDGRVVCVGNTFPTSFGDISNKYIWEWDGSELKERLVWGEDSGFIELSWEQLLGLGETRYMHSPVQFIRITGTAPATRMPEISKAINKLWELVPSALMIGNFVQAEELLIEAINPTEGKAIDVVGQITAELQGNVIERWWTKYSEMATAH